MAPDGVTLGAGQGPGFVTAAPPKQKPMCSIGGVVMAADGTAGQHVVGGADLAGAAFATALRAAPQASNTLFQDCSSTVSRFRNHHTSQKKQASRIWLSESG